MEKSLQPLTAHGLVGMYTSGSFDCTAILPSLAAAGIVTNSLGTSLLCAVGGIATTGSICTLGDNGVVAIAGEPRWENEEFTSLVKSQGNAFALAEAYRRHGRQLLEYLVGPFSFVIIDSVQKKVFASIDRLGQHTLYHSLENDTLLFGSTASAVMAQSRQATALTEQGVYDYVYFHMVPSPQSVYSNLGKLPAGHALELRGNNLEIFRYWTPSFAKTSSKSMSTLGDDLKRQLRDSVARSLDGGGAVGTFLSGGLDSSTVTGMLAELTGGDRPAYAIGFDQEGYDEMEFARISARHFGVELREYYVTPQDVLEELPTIATSYDEPFGNSSALPAYFCAKRAMEDGINTLLAGDGGDEIFAGNERYARQQVFNRYLAIPEILRTALVEPVAGVLPASLPLASKVKSYIAQAKVPLPDRLQSYNYLNRIPATEIFAQSFLARVDTNAPMELQRNTYHSLADASDLSRMLYLDWQYTLADNDLRKVSQMCAVAGVGVRYPMLDEDLVAFSCSIPDDWKLRRGKLRHFFKESLADWLPDATINKKKQGFGLPFGLWMQSYKPLSDLANDSLLRLKRRGYFRAEFLDKLVRLHQDEHAAYYGELIWILTVFDLWLEGRQGSTALISERPTPTR